MNRLCAAAIFEGPEGVKWELGLAGFCPRKMGFKPLGMGKNVENKKWEWDLRIAKWDLGKNELGNGIGTPPTTTPPHPLQDPHT